MNILSYALSEWRKYLKRAGIDSSNLNLRFMVDELKFKNTKHNFDSKWDDAFKVEIKSGGGMITASNARSCLIAVYECLRRLGFIFLNPTDTFIPRDISKKMLDFQFDFCADLRHRGVAPCAPREIRSFKRFIKWLPKVGLNTVFYEGWSGYLSYKSWYMHEENPFYAKEDFNLDTAKKFDKESVCLAKEIGLNVHAMGHGWNVAVVSDNIYNDMFLEDGQKINYDSIATVNGKKSIPNGILRCVNLCLSNKAVKQELVSLVVDYAKNNRYADVIHFWLADGVNKTCECEDCRKMEFSDQYVEILNAIDVALTQNNLSVKIAFLLYNDTLYPPKHTKLYNENRFIMLFCPISRDYSRSFDEIDISERRMIPKYSRNNIKLPVAPKEFIAFYKKWREKYKGETVWFDYHGYYASRYDISNTEVVSLAVRDIETYKKMDVDGLISCEFYRNAFPHGFLCYATARALFDKDFILEQEQEIYFDACFGENSNMVMEYLHLVNKTLPLFDYQWYGEIKEYREFFKRPNIDKEKFLRLKTVTKNLSERLSEFATDNVLRATCNKIFYFFTITVDVLCDLFIMKKNGEKQNRLIEKWGILKKILCKNEKFLLPYCSVDHLLQTAYWLTAYKIQTCEDNKG